MIQCNLDITAVQETKIKGPDDFKLFRSDHSFPYTFFKAECDNSYHGVGFFVKLGIDCKFKTVSNRLALLTINRTYNNKTHPLHIINAYAPTSIITNKNPNETDQFYQNLEDLLNTLNKKEVIICGDFNAKVGSSNPSFPKHIGKYTTGKTNINGEYLIDLIVRNNLYLCNTFYKHKLEHINTFTSNFTPKNHRNPTRSQIDYIIAPLNFKSINTDARAYNGLHVNTDHKIVIGSFTLNSSTRKLIYPVNKTTKISSSSHLKSNKLNYNENVNQTLNATNFPQSPASYWSELSNICLDNAQQLNPPSTKVRFNNIEIANLSKKQKNLRLQIDNCKDLDQKKELKTKRNQIIKKQHSLVRAAHEQKLLDEISEIENCKDDSHRFFKAIRIVQQKSKRDPILIKVGDEQIGDTESKIKEISQHFEKSFNCTNPIPLPNVFPEKLNKPFDEDEVKRAVSSLKNNKSPGCDNVTAEHLKYAPCTHKHIATILNTIAETGELPIEITQGILTPLQKPGKTKGPPENLRPIILLSTLRKILAICVARRIRPSIDDNILPITQTAYTSGRCTAELVFTFKVLAEKAVTSLGYNIHLLMLDMSKAFDSIQRGSLLNDLKHILDNDELHLVSLLINEVSYAVKLEGKQGQPFITNVGSPQGDSARALLFMTYLAESVKSINN